MKRWVLVFILQSLNVFEEAQWSQVDWVFCLNSLILIVVAIKATTVVKFLNMIAPCSGNNIDQLDAL